MPIDVRMPDGTIIRNVPDDATREQVMAVWQKAQAAAEGPSVGERLWKGLKDPVYGAAQLASKGIAAVGGEWGKRNDAILNEFIGEDDAEYEAKRKAAGQDGIDWGRIGGGAIATAPLAFAAGPAATLLGRVGQAAKIGAATGALQPVEQGRDFLGTKLLQTGAGAATAAVAQPLGEFAIKGVTKGAGAIANSAEALASKAKARLGIIDTADDAALRMSREAVGDEQWKALAEQVQKSIAADVAEALKAHGAVKPEAVRRLADFRAQGIQPRQSWVTRDPVQWTNEENLAGVAGAGEPLMQMRQAAEQSLERTIGPKGSASPAELGTRAVKGLQEVEDAAKARVDTAYDMFRQTAPDVQGNGARFVDRLSGALDEAMVGGALPGGIVTRLQKIVDGKFPITPSTLYQMQKQANSMLGGGMHGATGDQRVALGIFKSQIDDELARMGDELGPAVGVAKDMLGAARDTARQRFEMQEAVPALKALADGGGHGASPIAVERFFDQYVMGGSVKEVTHMWSTLRNADAKAAIRDAMEQHVRRAAYGEAGQEGGAMAQATFNKFLGQPGMREKLGIILGRDRLAELERVGRVGEMIKRPPAGNKVNTSNTSQGVANYASRLLGAMGVLPGVGPLVADPLRKFAQGRAVAGAMPNMPRAVADPRATFDVDPELAQRLARLLAAPLGAISGGSVQR